MKEHYVTHEQAQALKRLGFDKKVLAVWHFDGEGWNLIPDYGATFQHPKDILHWNTSHAWGAHIYSAPRLDQAQAWLREIKGIHISLNPYSISPDRYDGDNYFWSFELFHVPTGGWLKVNGGGFDTYDLALSAGIDKALELLNNKS